MGVVRLDLKDRLETVLGLLLLVHANVAARAQQVAILDRPVDCGQIGL